MRIFQPGGFPDPKYQTPGNLSKNPRTRGPTTIRLAWRVLGAAIMQCVSLEHRA